MTKRVLDISAIPEDAGFTVCGTVGDGDEYLVDVGGVEAVGGTVQEAFDKAAAQWHALCKGEDRSRDLMELEALREAAHAVDDRVTWSRYHHKLQAMYERGDLK